MKTWVLAFAHDRSVRLEVKELDVSPQTTITTIINTRDSGVFDGFYASEADAKVALQKEEENYE